MAIFYSASTGAFYDETVHGQRFIDAVQSRGERASGRKPARTINPDCRIPKDAREISEDEHAALLAAQGEGKQIVARGSRPVAIDPPPASAEDRLSRLRRIRDAALRRTDPMVSVPDWPLTDGQRAELFAWRKALREMPDTFDPALSDDAILPASPAWLDATAPASNS